MQKRGCLYYDNIKDQTISHLCDPVRPDTDEAVPQAAGGEIGDPAQVPVQTVPANKLDDTVKSSFTFSLLSKIVIYAFLYLFSMDCLPCVGGWGLQNAKMLPLAVPVHI